MCVSALVVGIGRTLVGTFVWPLDGASATDFPLLAASYILARIRPQGWASAETGGDVGRGCETRAFGANGSKSFSDWSS